MHLSGDDVMYVICYYVNTVKAVCFTFAEADMTIDEKYKKTLEEIEALKDHLGTTTCQSFYSVILLALQINN